MQFTSVVLPEPLGPIRPSTSRSPRSRSTPASAVTPAKRLTMFLAVSKGMGAFPAAERRGRGSCYPASASITSNWRKAPSSSPSIVMFQIA